MGRIIGSDSEVFTFHELHFFEQLWDGRSVASLSAGKAQRLAARLMAIQREGYLSGPDPGPYLAEAVNLIDGMELTAPAIFQGFLAYEARLMGARTACDQTPRNVFYIGEILEHYPTARIVNMVRDPRDVLLSQKRKWRRRYLGATKIPPREAIRSWVNYHPITVSHLWLSSVQAAGRWSSDPRVATVRFEDLLTRPEETARTVAEFLGICFGPGMLEVPIMGSSSRRDLPERKGIDASRAERWRDGGLDPSEVLVCQRIAGTAMRTHGYELDVVTDCWHGMAVQYASFPVKLGAAMLLNLRRMRSPGNAIRRRVLTRPGGH